MNWISKIKKNRRIKDEEGKSSTFQWRLFDSETTKDIQFV